MTTAFQSGAFQDDSFQIDAASGNNYADTLLTGSYSLTGISLVDSSVHADSLSVGTYSYLGKTVVNSIGYFDTLLKGTYTLTGQDITDVKTGVIAYADTLSVGAYSYSGNSLDDAYVPNVPVTTNAGGGRFRRQLIVVEIDGKEYRIFADELESFLASMKQEVKDEPVKKVSKKAKKVKAQPVKLPKIRIISAPVNIIPQLQSQIERTNVVLYNIMSKAMQRYSDDIEDEELILMML